MFLSLPVSANVLLAQRLREAENGFICPCSSLKHLKLDFKSLVPIHLNTA